MKFTLVHILALIPLACVAQSPYAGQQHAEIKALTAEEQSALIAGQGLGFAKAAELNGYPGPRHVLELSRELALSDAQRQATQALFDRMRDAAQADGKALVEAERELDLLYASKSATRDRVNAQLARIEALRTHLRGVHLDAHLEQAALLTPHQLVQYARLRGYGGAGHHH